MSKKVIRVFPRRTRATPIDDGVRVNEFPGFFDEADEIKISVSFSYDIPIVDKLAKQWGHVGTLTVGGPAMGDRGGEFTPGEYLKDGYVITTRGCPKRCWFCDVWRREGGIRELGIKNGWNVLDSNLLAASGGHVSAVFDMLSKQDHRAEFTGGFDASLLKQWHVDRLLDIAPESVFFAYDTADDLESLITAADMLYSSGFEFRSFKRPARALRAYVLIGYPGDSFDDADSRLETTFRLGFLPMAMLYRGKTCDDEPSSKWKRFQRLWCRPAIISKRMRGEVGC